LSHGLPFASFDQVKEMGPMFVVLSMMGDGGRKAGVNRRPHKRKVAQPVEPQPDVQPEL